MAKKLYEQIASLVLARANCIADKNSEWEIRHTESIETLVREHMPHGSGIDAGVSFDYAASKADKLVFKTSFHHMNEHGMYDGWTDHKVTVEPSLAFRFELSISGRDRNGIKDYLTDVFRDALDQEVA